MSACPRREEIKFMFVEIYAAAVGDYYMYIMNEGEYLRYKICDSMFKIISTCKYRNTHSSIEENLPDILKYNFLNVDAEIVRVDPDWLLMKIQNATDEQNGVDEFKERSSKLFHEVNGLGYYAVEDLALMKIVEEVTALNLPIRLSEIVVYGSRALGEESSDADDIDVFLEYTGNVKEHVLHTNMKEADLKISGRKLNITPVHREESGTILQCINLDCARRMSAERECAYV